MLHAKRKGSKDISSVWFFFPFVLNIESKPNNNASVHTNTHTPPPSPNPS